MAPNPNGDGAISVFQSRKLKHCSVLPMKYYAMSTQSFIPAALSPCVNLPEPVVRHGMVGESIPLQRLRAQMESIGPYFRTALITGERGTGKQLAARGLHALSKAAHGPFVVCDAATADEPLVLFESARHGTLFLREIADLPLPAQERLLRVLHQYRPGSAASRPTDARVVASSSRELKAMYATGQFRKDLYCRIAMVELKTQPLRTRGSDIILLARHFAMQFSALHRKQILGIEPATLSALATYTWPGNICELQQIMERAVMRCGGNAIGAEDLPPFTAAAARQIAPQSEIPTRLDEMVHRHVCTVMESCGGNKLRAADLLGISRSTLYRMLERS
jgi:DNA-binding NtrC family response regulator